jgi:hypothetical protein
MSQENTKLYLVIHETDIDGTYSTPEEATRETLGYEDQTEMERMLAIGSDYPYIKEIKAGDRWTMDR